jgi:hypothetical protein
MKKQSSSYMNDSLKPLSLKTDRPVDSLTIEILKTIDPVLRELACPYMLVGATARDLLLFHVYGNQPLRATVDVDFAIEVESWEKFSVVLHSILRSGLFKPFDRVPHRLCFRLEPSCGCACRHNSFWRGSRKRPDIPSGEGIGSGMKIASWFILGMWIQGVGYAGGGR